jgi:hypothetical protein
MQSAASKGRECYRTLQSAFQDPPHGRRLWTSVVQLVASHESAYLEHCRQYALDGAK